MDIYQHFRKDEQAFIDQVLSWKEQVERSYQKKLTDFLDPRELQIMQMLIGTNHDELSLHVNGGAEHTERKRMVIAPIYENIEMEDYQLTLLQATYQNKFITLTHPDVMGAFLSLGIDRKKLGDIYVKDGIVQIVMTSEIAPYVIANLTAIKKAKVAFEEKNFSELLQEETNWLESDKTVSSLRLDAVLKEIYNFSRKIASEYIIKKHVKVNHKHVEEPSFILEPGDIISVRGKGRSKLVAINGQTKKEKWKITTAILK